MRSAALLVVLGGACVEPFPGPTIVDRTECVSPADDRFFAAFGHASGYAVSVSDGDAPAASLLETVEYSDDVTFELDSSADEGIYRFRLFNYTTPGSFPLGLEPPAGEAWDHVGLALRIQPIGFGQIELNAVSGEVEIEADASGALVGAFTAELGVPGDEMIGCFELEVHDAQ